MEETGETSILRHKEDEKEAVSIRSSLWPFFGNLLPRMEIIFICQTMAIYSVVAVSLFNLTRGDDDKLWIALLSSCLGYMLPNPKVEHRG
jgi:hypothetical protein